MQSSTQQRVPPASCGWPSDRFPNPVPGRFGYGWCAPALATAAEDVTAAVAAGALRVGAEVGVPLHHYPLAATPAAQDAVEHGAVGKVLIDIA